MIPFFIYILRKNNICMKNKNYVTSLKKDGLHKNDMIDYIVGIFNNNSTKYDCISFCMKYINIKNPNRITKENDLRRLLNNSNDSTIINLFYLAKNRYNHVSRYRDDAYMENAVIDTPIDSYSVDMTNISNDLTDRLNDVANHLQDLVSSNDIQLNQDQLDIISKLENYIKTGNYLKLDESVGKDYFLPLLEKINSINDNTLRILILKSKMYIK